MICIYRIKIITKGPYTLTYIGSTVNFKKRKNQHLKALEKGRHPNKYLNAMYPNRVVGKGAIKVHVLEDFETIKNRDWLFSKEQKYISKERGRVKKINREYKWKKINRKFICANIENPSIERLLASRIKKTSPTRKEKRDGLIISPKNRIFNEYTSKYNLADTKDYSEPKRGSEVRERISKLKKEI